MITKTELQEFARLKGLNLGNAEKDYLLDMVLLSISKNTKNELVFKGGTCLYKFHGLDRFSEDLDFSAIAEIDTKRLIQNICTDLERFGIRSILRRQKKLFHSVLITLGVEGPLFMGKAESSAVIGIDINMKSPVVVEPDLLSYASIYQEIPRMHIRCMKQDEIFAEKVRAIMTREKARDVYDLWFLVQRGVKGDRNLINKKLSYYDLQFEYDSFAKGVENKARIWEPELKPLLQRTPPFQNVRQDILSAAHSW